METVVFSDDIVNSITYSDPTYEAWKLGIFLLYLSLTGIPILPMRHGNGNDWKVSAGARFVIPILPMRHGNLMLSWCSPPLLVIPILPMRHGNSSIWMMKKYIIVKIPILPMRHGNFS